MMISMIPTSYMPIGRGRGRICDTYSFTVHIIPIALLYYIRRIFYRVVVTKRYVVPVTDILR